MKNLPQPIQTLIESLNEDERDSFTVAEFNAAVAACGSYCLTREAVRSLLLQEGFELQPPQERRAVRGINSNPGGNRWAECPSYGGAGISSHTGTATAGGPSTGRQWTRGGKGCLP